jgi:hypothetical protein
MVQASGVTHRHYTWLERPARHKLSSLLQIYYVLKTFYNIGLRKDCQPPYLGEGLETKLILRGIIYKMAS